MEQPPKIDQARIEYLFAALLQNVHGQEVPDPTAFFDGVPMTAHEAFLLGAMFTESIYEDLLSLQK